MKQKELYKREVAHRMVKTFLEIRQGQGEKIPVTGVKRMAKLPANVLAAFAARPACFRTVQLASAKENVIVLRYAAGR